MADIKDAMDRVKVDFYTLVQALDEYQKVVDAKEARIASLQANIDKKNEELANACARAAKANSEADSAADKLAKIKAALEAYKAVVNA